LKTLAIDQGTTSTRAFILQPGGEMHQIAGLPHAQIYPGAGRVEHDPEELIRNIAACLVAADDPQIGAIGIDNQGESCLAWDGATGKAISPVIVWQDDRTASVCARLRADGHETLVTRLTGLPLDPYFSATKLEWILLNVAAAPTLLRQGRLRMGTTDAFFRDRLTGRFETDVTTASRTSLMNLANCQWDADLCRLFGVPIEALPQITPSTGDLGLVDLGGRKVPLTASIVDQQASLYGHGCRRAGDTKITFGTGAFALAVTGDLPLGGSTKALPTLAWQKAGEAPVYALDGGVYSAASAVNWAAEIGLVGHWDEINSFVHPSAAARGLVFVPALAGLACPHWNRAARGAWFGLSQDTTRADMMQALLEGIAFRMAEVIETMQQATRVSDILSIDGGMSANPWFCQMLSDVLGRELHISANTELTAQGTAHLAAEAAGQTVIVLPLGKRIKPRALPVDALRIFRQGMAAVETFSQIAMSSADASRAGSAAQV
jgi:glycerol kinase